MRDNEYRLLTKMKNEAECNVLLSLLQAEGVECFTNVVSENADEYLKIVGIPTAVVREIYAKTEQYDMAQFVLRLYEENQEINSLSEVGYTKKQRVFSILFLVFIAVISGLALIWN